MRLPQHLKGVEGQRGDVLKTELSHRFRMPAPRGWDALQLVKCKVADAAPSRSPGFSWMLVSARWTSRQQKTRISAGFDNCFGRRWTSMWCRKWDSNKDTNHLIYKAYKSDIHIGCPQMCPQRSQAAIR